MKKLKIAISGILFVLGSSGLQATSLGPGSYSTSYTITLSPGFNDVTNIIMFESGSGYGSTTWPFTASDCGGAGCTDTLTNPFPSPVPIDSALLIGITTDALNQPHLVLFTNSAFGTAANGVDWATLFPNSDEPTLIADEQLATSGASFTAIQPGFDGLGAFLGGNSLSEPGITQNGDALNYAGSGNSIYFNTGDAISVVSFTNGQVIGGGSFTSSFVPSTPEPGTLASLGLGFGAVALLLRRKRRA